MRSIYYAAPFFNAREFDVMQTVKNVTDRMEHLKVFYPYFASLAEQGNINDKLNRRLVYQRNEQALIHNQEVIAWVDRLQMDNQQVQLCSPHRIEEDGYPIQYWIGNCKELKQPDIGTVWEMGFARARGKTVAMFTLQEREAKINVMLAESVDIVLYGWQQLEEYLSLVRYEQLSLYIRDKNREWKGEVE